MCKESVKAERKTGVGECGRYGRNLGPEKCHVAGGGRGRAARRAEGEQRACYMAV